MSDLAVLLTGRLAGVISHVAGRPRFTYLDDYADDPDATPLSLSMPLAAARTYDHRVTAPWLLNLLPDDANVRERLAREFGVPVGSATALLQHIAIARIGDQGWAYPHGNAASTHIIKPGISRYAAQAFNEHLCLRSLRIVGIAAASTEFTDFDGVSALVVERYDRLRRSDGAVLRLHQEDLCQALSVWPDRKYATDGGPSATQIAGLLAREATQHDVDRFTDTVIAQYLLGAPDAHAKNYSVILNGAEATLAPIYDVASALPYDPATGTDTARVAMPIGGRAKFGEVTLHHVAKFARSQGRDSSC